MNSILNNLLLQAEGPQGGGLMPVMLIGMVIVMYFFMIRPQQKRAKQQRQFAESMGTGEKVITSSGVHGRITRENEDGTLVLEIDRNTNITIERSSISMELTNAYRKRTGETVTPAK